MRNRLDALFLALMLWLPGLAASQPLMPPPLLAMAAAPPAEPAATQTPPSTAPPSQADAATLTPAAEPPVAQTPPATDDPTAPDTPAAAAEPTAGETAAAEPAPAAESEPPRALVANGLLAQIFAQVEAWFAGFADEIRSAIRGVGEIRQLGAWWADMWADEGARSEVLRNLTLLLAILATALAAEALVARLLRRSRRLVLAHAEAHEAQARRREAEREAEIAAARPALLATPEVAPAGILPGDAADRIAAGMAADVRTAADGPAPEGPPESASPTQTAALHASLRDTVLARLEARRRAVQRWSLLARMPWAVADAVLSVLPLLAFVAVTALTVSWQGGEGTRFHAGTLPIFNAYISVRLALAAVRLMASPTSPGLRLLRLEDDTARLLFERLRLLFIVMAAAVATGDVLIELGASWNVRALVMKSSSLIIHLMVAVLVLHTRDSMRAAIRGRHPGKGTLDAARAMLADVWPYAAVFVVLTSWVVVALGVTNGFQRGLHFLAGTAIVLAVSRLLWILLVGALDRSFERANPHIGTTLGSGIERYHAWLRTLLQVLIVATTAIALLQAWGIDAISWFAAGTVGRRIVSAVWTIGVAAVIAVVVWESVSLALRRRVRSWTDAGDVVRAARLRTLIPMIRTVVLIAVGVIVVLTALNELGVNATPLLAGASIIGVALGFGSQKLVQDFINGIFLLIENTMQVGDTVTVAGVTGTVEYLSIRTVRLRAPDGSVHVIPFSSVTTVNNANRGVGTVPVRVSVATDSDLDAVLATLRRISDDMQADPTFGPYMLAPIEIFGVDQIGGAAVAIAGQIRCTDQGRWPVQREFNRRVLAAFLAQGIKLVG